jgi:hypothetical protein
MHVAAVARFGTYLGCEVFEFEKSLQLQSGCKIRAVNLKIRCKEGFSGTQSSKEGKL